jgi:branched-chain amino acid transport system permease protein
LFALLGGSITLTYSLTGVINLAVGAVAYATAYLFYHLVQVNHWGLLPATVFCLVCAPIFGLLMWAAIFRNIENKDLIVQLTATIGIAVALPALMLFALPVENVYQTPGILPHGFDTMKWWFINTNRDQLAAVVGAIICLGGLILAVEKTPFGLSTRAVVDKPVLSADVGINTTRLSAMSWVLSSLLTGAAGILVSPLVQLDAAQYTSLAVAALSVALVGKFRSLTITAVAGLALGVTESLITGYGPVGSVIVNGLVPALPFFLLAALLLIGRTSLGTRRDTGVEFSRPKQAAINYGQLRASSRTLTTLHSLRVPTALVAGAGVTLIGMFGFNAYWTGAIAAGAAFAVVFLGFTVSTGEGGVLCLGQAGFAATGAIVAGRLSSNAGLPLWLSVLIAVLCATVLGVVIGVMGSRLDQIGFALVTLAFALFCEQFAFNLQSLIPLAGVNYPIFTIGGLNQSRSDILLAAILFAVLALLLTWFRRSRFGRVCAAIRGNPVEGESIGINVRATRVAVFAIGSAVAGLGGALIGIEQGSISTDDFALLTGLVWLAVVVTIGIRGFSGALVAGLLFSIAPAAFQFVHVNGIGNLPTVLFGLGAVGIARDPRGFLAQAGGGIQGLLQRLAGPPPDPAPVATPSTEPRRDLALPLTGKSHD